MTIGTKIIKGALRKIQVHTLNSPASPEDIENSVDTLNSMLEMWTSKGIELGILPLESSGNELGEPPDTTNAIKSNLALYLADDYEDGQAVVSKTLRDNARRDFEDLQSIGYRNLNIPGKVPSDTLLTGQGNKRWWDSYRTFFGPGTTLGGESGTLGLGGSGGIGGGIPGPPGPPGPQGPAGPEVFATLAETVAGVVTDKSIAPDTAHGLFASPPGIGTTVEAPIAFIAGVLIEKLFNDSIIKPISPQSLSIEGEGNDIEITTESASKVVRIHGVGWPFTLPTNNQVPQFQTPSNNIFWEDPNELLNLSGTGDLVFNSAADILTRLGIGNTNQFLGVASGLPGWKNLPTSAHRNFIIDGDFSQVTPNITGVANNVYATKLVRYLKGTSTAVHDINRLTTGGPTVAEASHFAPGILEVKVTTAEASIPDAGRTTLKYTITGSDYSPLPLQTVTLDFWVKCSVAGLYSVGFQNSSGNRSQVQPFSIVAINTWERKVVTFVADSETVGWAFDDASPGLEIYINLSAGTDFQSSTPDAWNNDDLTAFFLDANDFNKTIGNSFQITMIGFYEGDAPGKFVDEDVQTIKKRVEWYVVRFDLISATDEATPFMGRVAASTQVDINIDYGTEMRIVPTITQSAPNTLHINSGTGAVVPNTLAALRNIGKNAAVAVYSVTGPLTPGHSVALARRETTANVFTQIDARHYD